MNSGQQKQCTAVMERLLIVQDKDKDKEKEELEHKDYLEDKDNEYLAAYASCMSATIEAQEARGNSYRVKVKRSAIENEGCISALVSSDWDKGIMVADASDFTAGKPKRDLDGNLRARHELVPGALAQNLVRDYVEVEEEVSNQIYYWCLTLCFLLFYSQAKLRVFCHQVYYAVSCSSSCYTSLRTCTSTV